MRKAGSGSVFELKCGGRTGPSPRSSAALRLAPTCLSAGSGPLSHWPAPAAAHAPRPAGLHLSPEIQCPATSPGPRGPHQGLTVKQSLQPRSQRIKTQELSPVESRQGVPRGPPQGFTELRKPFSFAVTMVSSERTRGSRCGWTKVPELRRETQSRRPENPHEHPHNSPQCVTRSSGSSPGRWSLWLV